MNSVFPELCSSTLGQTAAGSVARIPRAGDSFLILVTNESVQKDLKSIVILNLTLPGNPPVVFHEAWDAGDMCLYYRTPLRFEIDADEGNVNTSGSWWGRVGVIVSANNEFLIRAAAGHGYRLVNVQTGEVFSGETPRFHASFGS